MNCSSFYDGRNYIIACGQDEKCKIYSVRYKVVSPSKANSGNSVCYLVKIKLISVCHILERKIISQ